jgi:putative transposase
MLRPDPIFTVSPDFESLINFREGWRGHLWQGRFASYVMDEVYLMAAAWYIELNPVRAGLVSSPEEWPWSSAGPHLSGRDDDMVRVSPLLEKALMRWEDFLTLPVLQSDARLLRRHEATGRPLGTREFVHGLELLLDRPLWPRKAGRKPSNGRK